MKPSRTAQSTLYPALVAEVAEVLAELLLDAAEQRLAQPTEPPSHNKEKKKQEARHARS